MAHIRSYRVVPTLPAALTALRDIAYNLWLSWNPEAISLFSQIDPTLWRQVRHNPVELLASVDQERLLELADDEGFVADVNEVLVQQIAYMRSPGPLSGKVRGTVAYFSLEYGFTESLPIYSGGLGILAADHMKSVSDLGLPVLGVGLLYRQGYFQQRLDPGGWQQDFHRRNDFVHMRVEPMEDPTFPARPLILEVPFPGGDVRVQVWQLRVGRVRVFFLDTDIEENSVEMRLLTGQLYSGDRDWRMRQEWLLGVGGMILFRTLGIRVGVLHMNEGHTAFAGLARIACLMERHALGFDEVLHWVRQTSVFTTHTPVPAGHDVFTADSARPFVAILAGQMGLGVDRLMALGRDPQHGDGAFSMSVCALSCAAHVNGVSQLHACVARRMWQHLWPEVPEEHVPIGGITNGIHIGSWISPELRALLDRYLGRKWEEAHHTSKQWDRIATIPTGELWKVRNLRRDRLVQYVRMRLVEQVQRQGGGHQALTDAQEALDPSVLTIGFARRFATYKRGDLILKNPERLLALVRDSEKPIQLIFAGKAHPRDEQGKQIIKNIIDFIHKHGLQRQVVFIEDYDINVARVMVQGVDIWLNNPVRPHEASGTSGMKAAVNGVLNLSVRDGWWDEAYQPGVGWSLGDRDVEPMGREALDYQDSLTLYRLLEEEIRDLFYRRDQQDVPRDWVEMVRACLNQLMPFFNTHRMVREYAAHFYQPASLLSETWEKEFQPLRDFIEWRNHLDAHFPSIRIRSVHHSQTVRMVGEHLAIRVEIEMGGLNPEEIAVAAFFGRRQGSALLDPAVLPLAPEGEAQDGRRAFVGEIPCDRSGEFGYRIRVTPHHHLWGNPYDRHQIIWG